MSEFALITEILKKYRWKWEFCPVMTDNDLSASGDCCLVMKISPPRIKDRIHVSAGEGVRSRLSVSCRISGLCKTRMDINQPYISAQVVKLLTMESTAAAKAVDEWEEQAKFGKYGSRKTWGYAEEAVLFFRETISDTHKDLAQWWEKAPYKDQFPDVCPYCEHRYYLSGPVTGHPDYLSEFAAAEKVLCEKGWHVVNPVKVNTVLPEDTLYENFMHVCYAMMDFCDAIVLLPGWEKSSGAGRELKYAKKRKMEVLYFEDIAGEKK